MAKEELSSNAFDQDKTFDPKSLIPETDRTMEFQGTTKVEGRVAEGLEKTKLKDLEARLLKMREDLDKLSLDINAIEEILKDPEVTAVAEEDGDFYGALSEEDKLDFEARLARAKSHASALSESIAVLDMTINARKAMMN